MIPTYVYLFYFVTSALESISNISVIHMYTYNKNYKLTQRIKLLTKIPVVITKIESRLKHFYFFNVL